MTPWVLWVLFFYGGWLLFLYTHQAWAEVAAHWPIALAMFFGSYVAGSTPMGGGTVGFPVLVMLLGEAPALGRDFSFAIQSIGMTSASIFIVCRRLPLAVRLLTWAMIGALIGTPLGILLLNNRVPDLILKVLLAVIWAGFGMMTLGKLNLFAARSGIVDCGARADRITGFFTGFLGGMLVASVLGLGVDLMIYVALILLRHADLKIAIPTSVVLMAFTSLVGLVSMEALGGGIDPEVWPHWLAAAPVVILGAPLGALVVNALGRKPTLAVVAGLCLLQFVWVCWREREVLGLWGIFGACAGLLFCNAVFYSMYRRGDVSLRRRVAA